MHVTLRRLASLPSFRQQRVGSMLLRQIHRLNDARFQIVHFSIQTNHIHLIVEAEDRATITRKLSGLMISFAKRLNRQILGNRRGKVWADRYFRRDITTASEIHSVLRYVFGNAKRHGLVPQNAVTLDGYSSAWTFDGWVEPIPRFIGVDHWPRPLARTELLRRDWIAYGLLSLRTPIGSAAPSGASGDRSRAR
jgi:putative transposase